MTDRSDEPAIGRREVLTAGTAAAVGAGVLTAGAASAQEAPDPTTPITDTLSEEQAALLTEAAAALTEGDAVTLNASLRDPDSALPESLAALTIADIQSLHEAFQNAHEGFFEQASLAPALIGTARADTSACCCCTPASCCCAAAQDVQSRSRAIA